MEKVLLEDSEGLRETTPPIQGDPASTSMFGTEGSG